MRAGDLLTAERTPPRVETWTLRAVWLAVLAGSVAGLLAVAGTAPPPGLGPASWAAVAVLSLAPYLPVSRSSARPALHGRRLPAEALVLVLGAAGAALPAMDRAAALLPAALLAAQGTFAVRARRDASAGWALTLSAAQALLAMRLAPSTATVLLAPATLSAAAAGATLLHARALARRGTGSGGGRRVGDGELRRRVALGVALAALLLAGMTAIFPLTAAAPGLSVDGTADGRSRGPRRGGRRAGRMELEFSTELARSGIPMPTYEVLMEVVPRRGEERTGYQGILHLRGAVMSAMTREGARLRESNAPTLFRDADDGTADGWVDLAGTDLPATDLVELEVFHWPLPIQPQDWSLLFSLEPLAGVGLPEIRYDPDRMLVSPDVPDDWFSYRIRGRHSAARPAGAAAAPARSDDGRYLTLPPPGPDLAWITERAREVTAGCSTDMERVRAVERYFLTGHRYSLEGTEFGDVRGVAAFMRRREGYCTYFASASVLMLRSVGVPARIVTGFLASDWDAERGVYVVRAADLHTWFEVPFEGSGWLTFDPTPQIPRSEALAAEEERRAPGAVTWLRSLVDTLDRFAASSGRETTLGEVTARLAEAPVALLRSTRRHPLAVGLPAGLLVGLWLLRRHLRASGRGGEEAAGRQQARHLQELLERALRERGYRRAPAETPREFARRVARADAGLCTAQDLTERIYAVRFGGAEPDVGLRQDLERLRRGPRSAREAAPSPM